MGKLRWRLLAFGDFVGALRMTKGWQKLTLVLATVGSGVLVSVLGSQLQEWIVRNPNWDNLRWCLGFAAVLSGFLWWLQIQLRDLLGGSLRVHDDPGRACQALVIFLSPSLGLEKKWQEPGFADLDAEGIVKEFAGAPWQQPLRALRAHLERFSVQRLQTVYVVSSADRPDYLTEPDAKRRARLKGTVHYFADFEQVAVALGSRCGTALKVHHMASLGTRWQHGVDFESARDLIDALTAIFGDLRDQGVRDADILVDITGGSSLCSAVGAAVALDENRRFQYVSQFSGEVLPYDVDYISEPR